MIKHIYWVASIIVISFVVFYIGAAAIEGTILISNMNPDHRAIIFGIWLGTTIMSCYIYTLTEVAKTRK